MDDFIEKKVFIHEYFSNIYFNLVELYYIKPLLSIEMNSNQPFYRFKAKQYSCVEVNCNPEGLVNTHACPRIVLRISSRFYHQVSLPL